MAQAVTPLPHCVAFGFLLLAALAVRPVAASCSSSGTSFLEVEVEACVSAGEWYHQRAAKERERRLASAPVDPSAPNEPPLPSLEGLNFLDLADRASVIQIELLRYRVALYNPAPADPPMGWLPPPANWLHDLLIRRPPGELCPEVLGKTILLEMDGPCCDIWPPSDLACVLGPVQARPATPAEMADAEAKVKEIAARRAAELPHG